MDDPVRMDLAHTTQNAPRQAEELRRCERGFAGDQRFERFSHQPLHHEERDPLVLTVVIDVHEMLAADPGHRLGLVVELPTDLPVVGEMSMEELDRIGAFERAMTRLVDHAKAPLAEHRRELPRAADHHSCMGACVNARVGARPMERVGKHDGMRLAIAVGMKVVPFRHGFKESLHPALHGALANLVLGWHLTDAVSGSRSPSERRGVHAPVISSVGYLGKGQEFHATSSAAAQDRRIPFEIPAATAMLRSTEEAVRRYPELARERIAAALRGDRAALADVYTTYSPGVRLAVTAAIRQRPELEAEFEDLVSEVWTRFFSDKCKRLQSYEPERSPFGYYIRMRAFAIARNLADLRMHRSSSMNDALTEDAFVLFADDGLEARLLDRDLLGKLWAEIEPQLTDIDRVLLQKVFVDGQWVREVAPELGLSEAATHRRCQRLRAKIQAIAEKRVGMGEQRDRGHGTLQRTLMAYLALSAVDSASDSSDEPGYTSEGTS